MSNTSDSRRGDHTGDAAAHATRSSSRAAAGADHSTNSVFTGSFNVANAFARYVPNRSEDESPAVDTSNNCGDADSDNAGSAASTTDRAIIHPSSATNHRQREPHPHPIRRRLDQPPPPSGDSTICSPFAHRTCHP